jgi:hypothetical protein
LIIAAGFLFWFFKRPDFRFGYGFIGILCIFSISLGLKYFLGNEIKYFGYLFFAGMLYIIFFYYSDVWRALPGGIFKLPPERRMPVKYSTILINDYQKINLVDEYGTSWYAPLPVLNASEYYSIFPVLRYNSIKEGFRPSVKLKKMTKTVSIIIPAYNEGATIHRILSKIEAVQLINNIGKELIIVNDCSTDNTEDAILKYISENPEFNIRYYKHEINKGKGAALHTGISKATGTYLVIQGADLEYDPREYNILLNPILEDFADVVYGTRFQGGKPHRILFFWHSMGNSF